MSDAARHLNPPGLMDSRRFFSQAAIGNSGTTVYVAGQTGFRVDRSIAPTKEGQMAQAFENVKIALEAAQGWKFVPVQAQGQAVASQWILGFAFRRSGTEVVPKQVSH